MADSDDKPSCVMCPAPGHLLCGQCKEVRFCSAECQEAAWYSHRLLCKKFLDFRERPADDMHRVIYFPSKGSKPEFRWVAHDEERVGEHASLEELMEHQVYKAKDVNAKNPFNGRVHDRPLSVIYDDNFMGNYPGQENFNKALIHATGCQLDFIWSGPIVVSGVPDFSHFHPQDVDLLDYHHVCAWLINYLNDTDANKQRKGAKEPGVMISCEGERKLTGKTSKQVNVSRLHPVWHAGSLSPISQRIDFPLLAVPYVKTRPGWTSVDVFNASSFTQRGIDPSSDHDFDTSTQPNFGWVAKRWQDGKGNVLFVRPDRKSIKAEAIEAFVDFCQWHVTQYFQLITEREDEVSPARLKELQDLAIAQCTPEKWATYFQDWKKFKQQGIKDDKEVNTRVDGKVSMAFDRQTADRLFAHLSNTHQ